MIKFVDYNKTIKRNHVLKQINLEIPAGKAVGLFGRNASGKTMLLRAIAGLILPTTGSVYVNEKEINQHYRFPESTGLVIEHTELWPYLTALETLEYINSFNKRVSRQEAKNWLERLKLDPDSRKVVKTFSLGMKQKLSLAQALFQDPELLLLDEPTNALDDESRQKVYDIFEQQKKAGKTLILASHIKEDLDICDWIVELDAGSIKNIQKS